MLACGLTWMGWKCTASNLWVRCLMVLLLPVATESRGHDPDGPFPSDPANAER